MSRVWLHVYDLDEAPSGLSAIGLGAYHSALQLGDKEYAYGACDSGTGEATQSGVSVRHVDRCVGWATEAGWWVQVQEERRPGDMSAR